MEELLHATPISTSTLLTVRLLLLLLSALCLDAVSCP